MSRSLLILIVLLFQAPAFALQSFGVTKDELALMPPYCTAMYGASVGLPEIKSTIPEGCPSIHHYCDGLKSMIRADKFNRESGYWLQQGIQSFNSVVQGGWWKNCPLQAEAYVNLGNAYLRQSTQRNTSSSKAAASFMKALEVQPDYLPAYYALSDYYVRLGDKKKALNTAEEGLRYAPDSAGLLRRFKVLGGTTPPTPHHVTAKPMEQQDSPVKPPPVESVESATPHPKEEPAQAPEPKIGSPTNPWCRFCP
ncbi:tetratricopeptide repeat protein [Sulfuriferula multivorans]|uniref:tetratricopeptide repeat protein n=1 Tax=Sulfuriferula multivorans TaxID=1559896 RepID=UPI000F5B9343|nr:hypothetical protein [Sulfuriferula multivorans]